MNPPVLTILAGSNGSGKSTLTSSVREEFQQAPILDPDAIAKSIRDTLPGTDSDIEAGKKVLRRAEELIESNQSFTVERPFREVLIFGWLREQKMLAF